MDTTPTRSTIPLILLFGFGILLGILTLPTHTAYADSIIKCGEPSCSIDSTVRSESSWASETYTSISGSVAQPGSGEQPKYVSEYVECSSWHSAATQLLTFSYPAENSGSNRCWFNDRTMSDTDTCPPYSDRAAKGRVDYFVERVRADGSTYWIYARFRCVYPTDEYAPIERRQGEGKVYTGGKATFLYTSTVPTNPANTTHGSGGTVASTSGYVNRGVNLNNPEAYVGEWRPSFTATTARDGAGQPIYSYYRLDWTLDYRVCVKWAYPSWLGVPARYDCSRSGTDISANPYTYACNLNPPLRAGVDPSAVFVPADCASSWRCEVRDPTTVGGQPALVAVMRNGTDIPVTFPTPTVFGDGVRDPRRWQMNPTPSKDATPKLTYVTQSWSWDKWQAFKPNGTIAFHWASDKDHPFTWNTKYRFTADFYLPTQNTVGGASTYEWVTDITQCPETSNSPTIEVVRAVNK